MDGSIFWHRGLQPTIAKRRIQKKPHKYGQMKIEKVDSIRILGFDAKKKYVQIPRFRVPAKEKVPRKYFIWGKRSSPKNYSTFAVDEFSSLLSNVVLVYKFLMLLLGVDLGFKVHFTLQICIYSPFMTT